MSTSSDHPLENRIAELERQLAEAKAEILSLAVPSADTISRRFNLLFAHSRDIILFIRLEDGRILDANAAAVQAYGYSHAELLSLTIRDLRSRDTQQNTADQMSKADADGLLFETIHRRKDGSTFPVEVSSQGGSIGQERILISVIRDISERKQGEAERERLMAEVEREKIEAQKLAEELNAVIDALDDPVIVYDRAGVIYRVNASAVRVHGFDPSQQAREESNRTFAIRRPDGGAIRSDELPSARALQGEHIQAEPLEITNGLGQHLSIVVTSTPLKVNGALVGAVSVWHDISEYKQTEQALRAALAKAEAGRLMLDTILENIPIGLTITGGPPDFPLIRASRYGLEMNQRPSEILIGLPAGQHQAAWRIYAGDGITQPLPEQMPLYRASRFGERVRNLELVMEAQDGRRIPILVSAAPVRDAQGQIIAAINTWLDFTERKQAEAALAEFSKKLELSNRELEQFAFVASHDLQEPLRKIEAFGDLLLRSESQLDGRGRDLLERMRKAAGRMRAMVDGLLQLSRITTQGQPFGPVDLSQTAAEVLSDLEHQLRRSGGSVEIAGLPVVEGDALQMHQLLQNMIGNALKYHSPGTPPVVKVSSRLFPDRVQIVVEDQGIGFNPQFAEHIFQPFQRLVGQSEYEGSGMGLAICRRIVERHGGEITAQSEYGRGAAFIVTLPVRLKSGT